MGKSNVGIFRHPSSTQFDLTSLYEILILVQSTNSRGLQLKSFQGLAVLGFILLSAGGSQTHFRFIIQNRLTAYGCTHTSSVDAATEY